MRGEKPSRVSAVLARVSVVPLLESPSLASEQVSQLVLGEGAEVLDTVGGMLRVRTVLDGYHGYVHRGYVQEVTITAVEAWLQSAAWSEGAVLDAGAGVSLRAPHRARLPLEGEERVRLPDGSPADLISGSIRSYGEVIVDALTQPPAEWAWREFAGTPYLWGGVTTAGMDCSALVQTTFLARGMPLPRDAREQVKHGIVVDARERRAGDLLFFRGTDTDAITHVAILAGHETIVHSTVETGRVTREPWSGNARAATLQERLVAVRRLG